MKSAISLVHDYRPLTSSVPEQQWYRIRQTVIDAVLSAGYTAPRSAQVAIKATARFVAWAEDQGLPLNPEAMLVPDHVERYITGLPAHISASTRATHRGYLRRVGRASTRKAPWPRDPRPVARTAIAPPYSATEISVFWEAATSQATARRQRVLTASLTLGLGCGLRPREALTVTATEHVRQHRHQDLWVLVLPDRTVPVLATYVPDLSRLCQEHPQGPLIGPTPAGRDPFDRIRRGVEIPPHLPPLHLSRLRTTWMVDVLARVRVCEFQRMAGTASAKTMEALVPFVPGRWDDDEWLIRAAGPRS